MSAPATLSPPRAASRPAAEGSLVFLLSGQGSQYRQMGRALYDGVAEFRHSMDAFDAVLRAATGRSVLPALYGADQRKDTPFLRTVETHPALFMLQVSLARALMARGLRPALLLGSSLGEYAAAAVADAVDADALLVALARSAEAVEARLPEGAMLAVLGPETLYDDPAVRGRVALAGVSGPRHFVVSGRPEAIKAAQAHFAARGVITAPVPVSHAFHSPDMDLCGPEVAALFAGLSWRPPSIPVVSCLSGAVVERFSADHAAAIGRQPIRLRDAVRALAGAVDGPVQLVDIGPSGSMGTLARQAVEGVSQRWRSHAVLSPFVDDLSGLERVRALQGSAEMTEQRDAAGATRLACIFPGQGAQGKGMGADLFPRYPEIVAEANDIMGYRLDELCLTDSDGRLRDTRYTQPAIFLVNALAYRRHVEETGRRPDMVAGHSLGEINALVAAESLDIATGLRLVRKRAELMAGAPEGGMAAVIGLDPDRIGAILQDAGFDRVDVANRNSPTQTVISGDRAQVKAAEAAITAAGAKAYIPLPVSGAFHSRLMVEAEQAFAEFLASVPFQAPILPVISNVTARPYTADDVAGQCAALVSRPVDWLGCVRHMLDAGIEEFVELGPKAVLTGMVRDIRASHVPAPVAPAPVVADAGAGAGAPPPPRPARRREVTAETLGSEAFRRAHGLRYAYVLGGMVHGICSVAMVTRAARAGLLGFFGTGALRPARVEEAIRAIQAELPPDAPYGFNLLNGSHEEANIDLFLRHGVRRVEASAYIKVSPALVLYRLRGLEPDGAGGVRVRNHVLAKLSRPEVAREFLQPAPEKIVRQLLDAGQVTPAQAELARRVPMADDICVEADSGGHTDQGVTAVLLPAILRLRDAAMAEHAYAERVRVGSAGGIATPEAAVSALVLGADFLLTGSINQCTPEAGTSDLVKDMLGAAEVQDTAYAPAGDMFELGARVQVLKRGVFFPARANRLYELYTRLDGLDALDARTRDQLEEKWFRRSLDDIWRDCVDYHPAEVIARAEANPKQRMALVFRWYFGASNRFALDGVAERKVDFQVHCGPAMGAFNQWVAGGPLADWRSRHVDTIARHLMEGAAKKLNTVLDGYLG